MYLIKEVSDMSGVSVRTLHHYDQIGLLTPQKNYQGYRLYSDQDLSCLQLILFYKYLGFSLKEIQELLDKEDREVLYHLRNQLKLMHEEKQKLLTLIETLEKTIESHERRVAMSTPEKFKGFSYQEDSNYKQAAIDKYGKEVVDQAREKHRGKEQELMDGFNEIFFAFAGNMNDGVSATSKANIDLAGRLHQHICQYSFDCSLEVFSQIGYGYVQNVAFKENIDKFGKGTAQYVSDAIQAYVKNDETHSAL